MNVKSLLAVLASTLVSACATGTNFVGKAPTVTDQAQASQVVVYRPSYYGMLIKNTVAVDGVEFFEISAFTSVQFPVEQGKHTLTVKCFSVMPPGTKEDSIAFIAKPNKTYYFQVNTVGGSRCATVSEGDEIAAFNTSDSKINLSK